MNRSPETPERPDRDDHDALLAAVAKRRDRAAFAILFEYFAPRLKTYLTRRGAGDEAAEEVVQEAMIMVWRRAETFDPAQASAATWIFAIARNKRIDALRRERRPEIDPHDPALVPDSPPPGDEIIAAGQRDRRVREAIDALPEDQAALVRVAFYEDKSHRAIAAERKLPLGTVKSRLRLALGRLRRALEIE